MMDCPRCGFNQPQDRYCASCGLDVEHFIAPRTPVWRKVLISPNTYVILSGVLIVFLVLFILSSYAPAAFRAARGNFVSSRQAAEPDDDAPGAVQPAEADSPEASEPAEPTAAAAPAPPEPAVTDDHPAATTTAATPPKREPKVLEAEFFEVARGPSLHYLSTGDRIAEDRDARATLLRDPKKTHEWLRTSASSLGPAFTSDLRGGNQIVIETPPGTADAFRFAMMLQLTKWDAGRASLRFASPQAVDGVADLVAGETLVIMIEPAVRRLPPEVITKAGPGPWMIFNSPNFRSGETAWIFTVRLR